jgi:hypothetical protein
MSYSWRTYHGDNSGINCQPGDNAVCSDPNQVRVLCGSYNVVGLILLFDMVIFLTFGWVTEEYRLWMPISVKHQGGLGMLFRDPR